MNEITISVRDGCYGARTLDVTVHETIENVMTPDAIGTLLDDAIDALQAERRHYPRGDNDPGMADVAESGGTVDAIHCDISGRLSMLERAVLEQLEHTIQTFGTPTPGFIEARDVLKRRHPE